MSRYPFPATPDGWYALCQSQELGRGEVRPLRYFGRELVAFRGEDGAARVFDAHCPHLGAHLGHGGRVEGSGIRCPFHGWRYDGEGRLVEVPRLGKAPPPVRAQSYSVSECNGFVHAWVHARGAPPGYEVLRYRKDEEAWTPWSVNAYRVRAHVQDMTENILDRSHFWSVHDMEPPASARFEVRFEGPHLVVDQDIQVTAVSEAGVAIRSLSTNCGPGLVAVEVKQRALDLLTYITQTPIDDEYTDVRLHFSMRRLADEAATRAIADANDRITNDQFRQDVPIWEHKAWLAKPRLTAVDGPVARYREWYRQFYSGWGGAGREGA
jgi:nitrite reductase/ring-hydroxylating ferredoxin subunit